MLYNMAYAALCILYQLQCTYSLQQIYGENYASLGQCGCNSSTILALLQTAPELRGPPGPTGLTGADGRTGAPGMVVSSIKYFL